MDLQLSSSQEFAFALHEVGILVNDATHNQSNLDKYRVYNKSAVVLLCGKFESFIENFLEEFLSLILEFQSNQRILPSIKEHLSDVIIEKANNSKNFSTKKDYYESIIKLFGTTESFCQGFVGVTNFNYGKHGEKELKKLLARFGFEPFYSAPENQSFFVQFNSLNNIRNNILHQDATPSLTHDDILIHIENIRTFATKLDIEAYKLL